MNKQNKCIKNFKGVHKVFNQRVYRSKGGLGTLEGSRHGILPNGTLEIRNTKLQDQGSYVCVASNIIGRDEMEVQLEVKGQYLDEFLL